jgi:D-alanine-D-alanine ligase
LRIALLFEIKPPTVNAGLPADLYAEFETLETIQAIALGLERLGHTVHLVDARRTPWDDLAGLRDRIDLVFNTSVGLGTRFRELMPAAICEALRIPYTGSDPMAQAIAGNKHLSKLVAAAEGIATPAWVKVDAPGDRRYLQLEAEKVIVKPVFEGTSIGITGPIETADSRGLTNAVTRTLADYHQPVLVEQFIEGYEVTVPVLGNPAEALRPIALAIDGAMDVGEQIYGGEIKTSNSPRATWRADLPFAAAFIENLRHLGEKMHAALGCVDLSRTDFRISRDGQPYFIEINATPQVAPAGSSFLASGADRGLTFDVFLDRIVKAASKRWAAVV